MPGASASSSEASSSTQSQIDSITLKDLKAKQADLHILLTNAWEENVRLMSEAEERKTGEGAGIRLHLVLFIEHGRMAVVKLIGGCCFAVLPAFLSRALSAIFGRCCSPSAAAAAAGRPLLVTHESMMATLKRRTGRYAEKQLTPEEKLAQQQRNATFVETDKWEAAETYVWFPRAAWKQKWDMLIMILILYSCISVPFRIGMMADAVGAMWLFEVCVTLFFLTDLCFNFNTAYIEGPHWVIDRGMIANNYLRCAQRASVRASVRASERASSAPRASSRHPALRLAHAMAREVLARSCLIAALAAAHALRSSSPAPPVFLSPPGRGLSSTRSRPFPSS